MLMARVWSARSITLACLTAFSALLVSVYVNFLTRFYYLGFTYNEDHLCFVPISLSLLILSVQFLPVKITKISDSMLWLLFWLLYGPIVLLVPIQAINLNAKLSFLFSVVLSFLLMIWASSAHIRLPRFSCPRSAFYFTFFSIYVALNISLLIVFRGNIHLVGFDDVYELRKENDALQVGSLIGYVSGMLAWAFNPFLLAVGLVEKKKLFTLLGVAGQVLIYSTLGHKGVLLTSVIVYVFYKFYIDFEVIESDRLARLIVLICLVPVLMFLFVEAGEFSNNNSSALAQFISIIYMRSFGMMAAMMGVYIDFFQSHPYTYYSHINVVSLFVDYPYGLPVGEEIGFDLVGAELNANASFFATDGYAGFGNVGVVAMGPVVGLFFAVANSLTQGGLKIACASLVPFAMILSNSSFFTTLLTGGGMFLLVFVYLYKQSTPVGDRTLDALVMNRDTTQ